MMTQADPVQRWSCLSVTSMKRKLVSFVVSDPGRFAVMSW